jgi:hypothetical protein
VAALAWTLAGMPAQARCAPPLSGAHIYTGMAGIGRPEHHAGDLPAYHGALVHYAARRRDGEPISTAFVESAVYEIIAKHINKKQQMRWNSATVQPFLDVRTLVQNDTLEDAFRRRHPGFCPASGDSLRRLQWHSRPGLGQKFWLANNPYPIIAIAACPQNLRQSLANRPSHSRAGLGLSRLGPAECTNSRIDDQFKPEYKAN